MLLLDPLLVTPPEHPSGKLVASSDFWDRILHWASDKRVVVGEETYALIYDEYARYGYPEQSLNLGALPAGREYQSALNALLSRIRRHTEESRDVTFSSEYLGTPEHHLALQLDVSGTAGPETLGIATDQTHWTGLDDTTIEVDPPPPSHLEPCFQPGVMLQAQGKAKIRSFFSGKRLHIVGGQRDQRIVSTLASVLDIDSRDVSWLACEKAKPPRDLDKRWKMLDGNRDITLCVTGRVGHATSKAAAQASQRAGAPHLLVELPGGIESALVKHAMHYAAER